MKLTDLIRGNRPESASATVTVATTATHVGQSNPTVARVATVSVAKPRTDSAEPARGHRSGNPLLTPEEADACHFGGWNDREIETFSARVVLFIRRGLGPDRADDLAESLTLRDREGLDMHVCPECQHYTPARCLAAARGELPGADRRMEPMSDRLHRGIAFAPIQSIERVGGATS